MRTSDAGLRSPELDAAFDAELEAMALAAAAPPVDEPREAALPRYVKFQVLDYVKHRGVWLLGLSLIGLWIFHHNYATVLLQNSERSRVLPSGFEPRLFRNIIMGLSMALGGLGSLISAGGIVSRDREGGHQRFLFAKPVRIASYYLQSFAINGIGLLAIVAIMGVVTAATFMRAVPLGDALLGTGAVYAAVGGLTFLLSALVRFDLVLAALLAIVAFPLSQMAQQGHWWAVATSWLLPPMYKLEAFGRNLSGDAPMRYSALDAVVSLAAYGMVYVAAAVAVLKRRSITR